MTNATKFWGAADTSGADGTCGASPHTYAGTGTQTCNGGGDGCIGYSSSSPTANNESHRYWQHLANAGLVNGSFTGIATDAGYQSIGGTNVPGSKLGTACWSVYRNRNPGEVAEDGSGIVYGNMMSLGTPSLYSCGNAILTPGELWNIDTKIDDGKSRQGTAITSSYTTCTDASSVSDLNASYLLTSSSKACTPFFLRVF